MKNLGVLLGKRDTDYTEGLIGGIQFEERLPSADWKPYLPTGEKQKDPLETMACVSFSALNSIETQIKFLTGLEPNYSDRFLARMSNTTPQGNYQYLVADSIRKNGLVNQEDWPCPMTWDWNTYYSQIPQEIQDKGKRWLDFYDVQYEWLPSIEKTYLIEQLKHAPLQIVINNGTHAVELYNVADVHKYFDSYDPYLKQTNEVRFPLKIILTPKNNMLTLYRDIARPSEIFAVDELAKKKFHLANGQSLKAGQGHLWVGKLNPTGDIDPDQKDLSLYAQGPEIGLWASD